VSNKVLIVGEPSIGKSQFYALYMALLDKGVEFVKADLSIDTQITGKSLKYIIYDEYADISCVKEINVLETNYKSDRHQWKFTKQSHNKGKRNEKF
jgi:hypothetical protein